MADNNGTNTHQPGAGSLEGQRQPEPVADSARLAQEKGSTHQFALPEVHDVSHIATVPPSQTEEGMAMAESTGTHSNGRKRSTKETSANGSKSATSTKKTTSSAAKRTTSKAAHKK